MHSHRRIQQGHPADQPVSVPAKATTLSEMMWSKNQDTSAAIRAPPPPHPAVFLSNCRRHGVEWPPVVSGLDAGLSLHARQTVQLR